MDREKLSEFYSIVLLGTFNPLLFHPYWLRERNIISDRDVNMDNAYMHPELTQFNVGKWMQVIVNPRKIEFKIKEEVKVPMLRDLVIQTLEQLPDVKITAIGINRGELDLITDPKLYYAIGAALCPLKNWTTMKDARVQSIRVQDEDSELMSQKSIGIKSVAIKKKEEQEDGKGIDVDMNYNYDMPKDNSTSKEAIRVIDENIFACFDDYVKVMANLDQMVSNAI